jgi:hypothetical protein
MRRVPPPLARAILAAFVLWAGIALAAARPHVVLVVVDGLDSRAVAAALTPTIWSLGYGREPRGVFYPRANAVLPSVTNANHASLFTGVYPVAHGIVGNFVWDAETAKRRRLENRSAIEVEPLFEESARAGKERRSAAIFGKWKLLSLFGPVEPLSSVRVWADLAAEGSLPDPRTGLGSDERTMDEVLRVISASSPELVAVNLGDVDRTSHVYGPSSPQARKSILEADRQIERLIAFLRETDRWVSTVLVITADHGFASVAPDEADPNRTLSFGRELARVGMADVAVVGNGGMAFVYLRSLGIGGTLSPEAHETLRRIRALALEQPDVVEALYRRPNPVDGGDAHTLDTAHPEWRLAHPRLGELVLVARSGHQFDDPPGASVRVVRGNHGGPEERAIPLVWSGGFPGLAERKVESERVPESPDVGMTIRRLLGLPAPRDRSGREIAPRLRGRVLDEVFAPSR